MNEITCPVCKEVMAEWPVQDSCWITLASHLFVAHDWSIQLEEQGPFVYGATTMSRMSTSMPPAGWPTTPNRPHINWPGCLACDQEFYSLQRLANHLERQHGLDGLDEMAARWLLRRAES